MNPGGYRPPHTSGGPPTVGTAGWARCDVCNSELPVQFTQLHCLHRFCPNCTGITQERKACPLCVNRSLAKNLGALHLGGGGGNQRPPQPQLSQAAGPTSISASSPPYYADFNQRVSDPLTIDTSFLIWDPPKVPPQPQSSSNRSHQQPPQRSAAVDVNSFAAVGDEQPSSQLFSPTSSSLSTPNQLAVYPTNFNLAPGGAAANQSPWSQPPPGRTPVPLCTSCSEGVVATSRCEECRELLCAGCVQAHYRVRMTRDHHVVPLTSASLPLREITQTSSGSSGHSPLTSQSGNPAVCGPHEALPLLFCQTCKQMPLCAHCLPEHKGHTFNNPSQEPKQLFAQIVAESKQYQRALEEAVESVQRMAERVDASVQAIVGEVRSVLHLHISALEERKRDLLQRIDTVRHSKIGTLKTQSEMLHNRLSALNHALAQAESSLADNPDSNDAKNMQDLLIGQLQEPRSLLAPHETDQLRFVGPETTLLTTIRALGEIQSGACARTSHILGDGYKRAIRDRPAFFTVQAKDATGDQCLAGGDPVTLEVIAPDGTRPQTQIRDRQNGTYIASYMPTMDGVHLLQLKIRGCPILNSPMSVQVRKGRNYADIGPTPLFSFGGEGGNDGQLCRPWGICCDRDGRIVVADRSNNRIQIFDKNGRFIMKFGSSGARPGQFDRPAGVTVNNKNQLIIADKDNHRIQVFEADGTFIFKFGERGRGVGMFNYPWDVACNTENDIAVSDTRNHRVQVFTASGQFLRKFGFDNSLFFKHLDSPRGLCYLPDGQLLITDFNNHRLAIVSNNSNDIKFYGREGDADGAFRRPQGVDVDPEGHVIVADSRNNRLQVLAPDDLRPICSFGSYGDRSSVMDRPSDICTSPDGRIYVVDFGNNKVHVF